MCSSVWNQTDLNVRVLVEITRVDSQVFSLPVAYCNLLAERTRASDSHVVSVSDGTSLQGFSATTTVRNPPDPHFIGFELLAVFGGAE